MLTIITRSRFTRANLSVALTENFVDWTFQSVHDWWSALEQPRHLFAGLRVAYLLWQHAFESSHYQKILLSFEEVSK